MTCHLTLFLAYFSVIFSRFYQHNKGVLEQLSMILGQIVYQTALLIWSINRLPRYTV